MDRECHARPCMQHEMHMCPNEAPEELLRALRSGVARAACRILRILSSSQTRCTDDSNN